MRLYIDSAGNLLSEGQMRARYGTASGDFASVDDAVRKLGFVCIDRMPTGERIFLNPQRATPAEEASLFFYIAESPAARFLVSFKRDQSTSEVIYRTARAAIEGISRAFQQGRAHRGSRFARRAKSLGSLKNYPVLDQLLARYCARAENVRPASWNQELKRQVNGRFLLAEFTPRSDIAVLRELGHGFGAFDASWTIRSSGLQLDEQPDIEYGAWLDSCYREVAKSNEPATDEVEAIIFSRRFGFRRFSYRRLMLPLRKRGRAFLLSVSAPDRNVSLDTEQVFKGT